MSYRLSLRSLSGAVFVGLIVSGAFLTSVFAQVGSTRCPWNQRCSPPSGQPWRPQQHQYPIAPSPQQRWNPWQRPATTFQRPLSQPANVPWNRPSPFHFPPSTPSSGSLQRPSGSSGEGRTFGIQPPRPSDIGVQSPYRTRQFGQPEQTLGGSSYQTPGSTVSMRRFGIANSPVIQNSQGPRTTTSSLSPSAASQQTSPAPIAISVQAPQQTPHIVQQSTVATPGAAIASGGGKALSAMSNAPAPIRNANVAASAIQVPTTPSSQTNYIESGTGTQLTGGQIISGTFPPGTFFIQSGTGAQVTQTQLIAAAHPVSSGNSSPPRLPPGGSQSLPVLAAPSSTTASPTSPAPILGKSPPSPPQGYYVESGTGTQLTADQIRSGTFPTGTYFIQSGSGAQVTQAQLIANAQPAPSSNGSTSANSPPQQQTQTSASSAPPTTLTSPAEQQYPHPTPQPLAVATLSSNAAQSNNPSFTGVLNPLLQSSSMSMSQTTPATAISPTSQTTLPAQTATTAPSATATTYSGSGAVTSIPVNLTFTPQHPDNCVLFLSQDEHIPLPGGLYSYQQKQNIANVAGSPQVGDVAIIRVNSGPDAAYGHVAVVTSVSANSITILEADWNGATVDQRISSANDLQVAQQQLNITGFYRPPN
jgi:hypothetical protein